MVSVEKITHKFSRLDEFLAILQGMQSTPLDAFMKDKILKILLILVCQACRTPLCPCAVSPAPCTVLSRSFPRAVYRAP